MPLAAAHLPQTSRAQALDLAILANLRLILETRHGEALAAPTLGTLDLADLVHGDRAAARILESNLRATILRHEPRLDRVDIAVASDHREPTLALTIRAHLRAPLRAGRGPLVITGRLSPLGDLALSLATP